MREREEEKIEMEEKSEKKRNRRMVKKQLCQAEEGKEEENVR